MSTPAFALLVCPDPEMVRLEARRLTKDAGRATTVYWGDEELPATFWQDLGSPGLLGGDKGVVVRGAHKLSADTWRQIAPLLPAQPSEGGPILPVLCWESGEAGRQTKLPKWFTDSDAHLRAQAVSGIWNSPGLTAKTIGPFVSRQAAGKGLNIPGPILQRLIAMLPPDAARINAELDKLALAAGATADAPAPVVEEYLEVVCAERPFDFWEFLNLLRDAGGRGGFAAVWQDMQSRITDDGFVFMLVGSLRTEARKLWQVAHGESPGRMPPFVVDKMRATAARLGTPGIGRILTLALDAEFSIKSGKRNPRQSLEILVAELCKLFSGSRV